MSDELNRNDFWCMKSLYKNNCFNYFTSMTIPELSVDSGVNKNTVYKRMQRLCELGYAEMGCAAGSADTYFLSLSGKKLIETYLITEGV